MEIVKKTFLFLLILIYNESNAQSKSVIEISFNRKLYDKIANDSVKQLYENQQLYYTKNPKSVNRKASISENYKFEELKLYSIPKFRLRKEARKNYQCKSNIESFIEFNEYNKYQDVLIYDKYDSIICTVDIPNFYSELSRINNPDLDFYFDNNSYNENVLELFLSFPNTYHHKQINKILKDRRQSFLFTIFGIDSVLFEIEKETGQLYANWIGTGSIRNRMLANDYIRKYIGRKVIREFASGNYTILGYSKPCNCKTKESKINLKLKETSN
jgi:hypothetical protein